MKEKDLEDALTNRDIFKNLVESVFELRIIHKEYPKIFEQMIKHLLEDPNTFKRLIQNENDLYHLSILYPDYDDVFGQKTVQDAVAAMHSRAEIKKSARLLAQSVRTQSGILTELPTELLFEIGFFARNERMHSKEQAKNIFQQSFAEP